MPLFARGLLDQRTSLISVFSPLVTSIRHHRPTCRQIQDPGDPNFPGICRHPSPRRHQGSRSRKDLAGGGGITGMEFENEPVPLSAPGVFVVPVIRAESFVIVSTL